MAVVDALDQLHAIVPLLTLPSGLDMGHMLQWVGQPAPTPPPGAPDFSKITPDPSGVPKTGVLFVIAQVILYVGLGVSFIVLLFGIVTWVGGHIAGGMHLSQNAKTNMLRAGFGGILLTAAGGIWTWITSV
jgi:hypothetical protein